MTLRLTLYRIQSAVPAPAPPREFRPLLPLVCHPGGKSKSRSIVNARIPAHDRYVEPFFGGGSIFWGKPPAPKGDVISDTDKALMGFYRRLNCRQLRRCVGDMVRRGSNPEKLRIPWKRRAKALEAGSSDTCDVWIGKTYGYGCKTGRTSFSPSSASTHKGAAKADRCDEYKNRLKRTTILDGDYQGVMRRYDGAGTFFYLDPPWLGIDGDQSQNGQYYKSDKTSPESVCAFLRRIKGKFLLHYDDNSRIRKACSGFRIERVPWLSTMYKSGAKKKHALLISNFKLKR